MIHKAYESLGQLATIVDTTHRNKLGAFRGSQTLDFIEPLHFTRPEIEDMASSEGFERISPDSPIISIHYGVQHEFLTYVGRTGHGFRGQGLLFTSDGTLVTQCSDAVGAVVTELLLSRFGCREEERMHIFEGRLEYECGDFINDGNPDYAMYRTFLQEAGFKF